MQFTAITFMAVSAFISGAMADLHHVAACTGINYVWGSEINSDATSCTCWNYQRRNTGNK
ncbi:hypothetical protein BDZ45DRAFT_676686 [Acephala macrosclerotiorum]|nr:hypothetical protein BDZ45DRAFT_676686 [Acephala macrosclerotiorum]